MGIRFFVSFLILFIFTSCISTGYDNNFGVYVPKRPRYELKNMKFELDSKLDLENIYFNVSFKDSQDKNLVVKNREEWTEEYARKLWIVYYKFYANGRVSSFSFDPVDKKGKIRSLTNNDLDPNYHSKDYYITQGDKIVIERFVYGTGYGTYVKKKYNLKINGDFEYKDQYYSILYSKEKLPSSFIKYEIDW